METESSLVREVYAEGKENAAFHLNCADSLNSTATTTLTLIAAAGYGALGYGAHLLESGLSTPVAIATLAVALHLLVVGSLIVTKCLKAGSYEPTTNEPLKLYHPQHTWDQILEVEIELLHERIKKNSERNEKIGCALNCLTWFALLVPLTFLLVWAVAVSVAG